MTKTHIKLDVAIAAAMIKAREIGVKMFASDCEEILKASGLESLASAPEVGKPIAWFVELKDGKQFVYDEGMLNNIATDLHAKRKPLYTTPQPDTVAELVKALEHSRACLEAANNSGLINDTLWAGNAETLFDYMDAAIAKAKEMRG